MNGSFDSYRGLWDTVKFKIKDHAIRYGKKRKSDSNLLKIIYLRIMDIDRVNSIPNFVNNSNLCKQLFDSEIKLNKILDQEVTGFITSCRAFSGQKRESGLLSFS